MKGSNELCPEPFRIGQILEIYTKKIAGSKADMSEIKFKVLKFYRIENTHKGHQAAYHNDLNKLYWSEEVAHVSMDLVCGKCTGL